MRKQPTRCSRSPGGDSFRWRAERAGEPEPSRRPHRAGGTKSEADPEIVERVSRYNFDELSRILTDRVGGEASGPVSIPTAPRRRRSRPSSPHDAAGTGPAPNPAPVRCARHDGALVNLGGETLVLNRLPLGILVFRDQQVLFANRAITEMIGLRLGRSLRDAGLAAIFPAGGPTPGRRTGQPSRAARRHAGAGDGAAAVDLLAGPPCADAVGQRHRSPHRPRGRGARLCRGAGGCARRRLRRGQRAPA